MAAASSVGAEESAGPSVEHARILARGNLQSCALASAGPDEARLCPRAAQASVALPPPCRHPPVARPTRINTTS